MDIAMDREELIAELQRLEKYGFYVIEEAYERSSWALNFIDDERWHEE